MNAYVASSGSALSIATFSTYLHQGGNFVASVSVFLKMLLPLSVYLSISEQDCAETFLVTFMELCRIMDYCYGKNKFSFRIDPTHHGLTTTLN